MRIVFQGDSVTDAGRNYADPHHLGSGYPKYTAEELRRLLPDIEMEFINQGISGNRTADLLERWEKDCLAYRPDVLSLMIGINDTWRRFDSNTPTLAPQYGDNLRRLLQQVKERTHAKICLIDPILLPTDETKNTWRFDLDEKIQILREVAREYADVYLPLDGLMAARYIGANPVDFTTDGVHPNEFGARVIGSILAPTLAALIKNCC